jgi:hypothetical protein
VLRSRNARKLAMHSRQNRIAATCWNADAQNMVESEGYMAMLRTPANPASRASRPS